jgi:hypothetical protein
MQGLTWLLLPLAVLGGWSAATWMRNRQTVAAAADMAQASLSTGSRSHLLHVSRGTCASMHIVLPARDDGQDVRVSWSTRLQGCRR